MGCGEGGGSVYRQLLVALREPRIMLGRATSEHLEEALSWRRTTFEFLWVNQGH